MFTPLEKLTHLRAQGWALQIFIPSGKPTRTHQVDIGYDNQGEILHKKADTLEQAIELVWEATQPVESRS